MTQYSANPPSRMLPTDLRWGAKEKFAGSTIATVPTRATGCGEDRDAVACFDAGDIGADFDDFT